MQLERCGNADATFANAARISEKTSGSIVFEKSTPWISATKVGWSSLIVMWLKVGCVRRPGILFLFSFFSADQSIVLLSVHFSYS